MPVAASPFSKTTAENIVRHQSGTLYLQAKVAGRKFRESLKTGNMKAAKVARDERLKDLRAQAARGTSAIVTIGDALQVVEDKVRGVVGLKESTRTFYRDLLIGVRRSLPVSSPGGAWTAEAAAEWWTAFAGAFAVNHSNNALRIVRMMTDELSKAGLCASDVMAGISRKRAGDKAVKKLPSPQEFDLILGDIQGQKKACSAESADLCEFLAWSGLRKGEACHVEWEHTDADWLTVTMRRSLRIGGMEEWAGVRRNPNRTQRKPMGFPRVIHRKPMENR